MSKISKTYKGYASLRKAGIKIEYTRPQLEEFLKCKNDPVYFIENYCKIVSLDKGLIKFKMHPYQKRMVRMLHENRFIASLLGRQMGKSITVAAYLIYCAIFKDNTTIAVLAHKATGAREVMSRIQLIYENLPEWLQHGVKSYNKGSLELENGSKIFTAATSANAVTGKSCSIVYIDEAAVISNTLFDEFFASAFPTLSSGSQTKMILTSTPRGYNHYYHIFKKAELNQNGFVTFKAHWSENPERDQKWADAQKEKLGDLLYQQEVECDWLGSSNTLISGGIISRMATERYTYSKNGLDIIHAPVKGHTYVMVVDTSRGVEGDYSAFTVIDVTEIPYRLVAKYRDNTISPMLYPTVVYTVAKDYFDPLILVEINDIGGQVADILYSEMEYENMVFISKEKGGQRMSAGYSKNISPGVRTDKLVKRVGCSTLKSLVEEFKFIISDSDVISEMSTFVESKGSFAADDGYHDDLVMTLVLFSWLTTQAYFKELTNVSLRHSLYEEQMLHIEQSLTPFGFINNGKDDIDKYEMIEGDYWAVADAPYRDKIEKPTGGWEHWSW